MVVALHASSRGFCVRFVSLGWRPCPEEVAGAAENRTRDHQPIPFELTTQDTGNSLQMSS